MTPKENIDRMTIIRSISRAIKHGEEIPLSHYNPPAPTNAQERVLDAIINDSIKAKRQKRTPAFSGIADDQPGQ